MEAYIIFHGRNYTHSQKSWMCFLHWSYVSFHTTNLLPSDKPPISPILPCSPAPPADPSPIGHPAPRTVRKVNILPCQNHKKGEGTSIHTKIYFHGRKITSRNENNLYRSKNTSSWMGVKQSIFRWMWNKLWRTSIYNMWKVSSTLLFLCAFSGVMTSMEAGGFNRKSMDSSCES